MRIIVSDYSGHPFQVQLSRALAARGHDVLHIFSSSFQTPKGNLTKQAEDPATFNITPVQTDAEFAKHSFFKRRSQEIEIGGKIGGLIRDFRPDVVISSNAPLDTQRGIEAATKAADAAFIFWVQDVYSHAIINVLSQKFGIFGKAIGKYYQYLEAGMIRRAAHNVVISDDFVPVVSALAGIPASRISVVENWAPLDEIAQYPRDNDWALANLPASPFRAIYSGTIGFKHNPDLLLDLARKLDGDVFVFSEGPAVDYIRAEAEKEGLTNLHIRGWVAFADLPKMLAAGDALLVILEPEAGIYSVPSKCLTYMCVGRPIVGAIPAANLAASLITRNHAGLVAEPDGSGGFADAVASLTSDPVLRKSMGDNARAYVETAFNIDNITDKFVAVIEKATYTAST